MGLFDKKKSNTSKVGEKDFAKLMKDLKGYKSLKKVIGDTHAKGFIKASWAKASTGSNSIDIVKDDWKPMLDAWAKYELTCVLQAHYFIGNLFNLARTKCFSKNYSGEVMRPRDYGAADNDSDLDKAAAYLIHTSNSLRNTADNIGAPITRNGIKLALTAASNGDIRSEGTLRALHRGVVDQATLKATRGPAAGVPYPSTGGAGYLLERTFGFARGLTLPPVGDAAWFDVACFLMGATIRSHGFTDGNGRIGRAAFAAAMIKGQCGFSALKVSAEKFLHGLDKVS